ncbi:UDP-N-acetylglucosamine diphosphorylase/glucosamine-1-phosphate N-acetyltransferase [Gammaproteobacteria bacterium 45_16_T64]|nr:UDP-N-acetylglucosamine diphosphorylase/glucosamine-1-phosphate N-acetyltransferase [Gammaproteobacteria bacterium 45_16_T64]
MMDLNVVILAAGKGTRMKSNLPKVLQPLAKKPLISHVVDTSFLVEASNVVIVYGHGGSLVKATIDYLHPNKPIRWVEQAEQLGTGHAVKVALPELKSDSRTLILYGDVPLVSKETLQGFIAATGEQDCGLLTVDLDNPTGYGRIIRDASDNVTAIVEEKDASEEQKKVTEANTGIMLVNSEHLQRWLPALGSANSQGEYYLTDIVKMASDEAVNVKATMVKDPMEVEGVNDKLQLAKLERAYQLRQAYRLMQAGATIVDPERVDIRGSVSIGQDCFIDVNAVFEGTVTLGDNCQIGPNCFITNSKIGNNAVIKANTVIEDAVIGSEADIGPFARIRPGTVTEAGVKIGNFVETKKAHIQEGSKVNHLTYIGDAEIGKSVNIGAGTITCNYDGVNKHKTIIGDGAFIGSNTSLVAPITVGVGATVGAGSTVSRSAKEHALTVTRAKQLTLADWQRPTKKS